MVSSRKRRVLVEKSAGRENTWVISGMSFQRVVEPISLSFRPMYSLARLLEYSMMPLWEMTSMPSLMTLKTVSRSSRSRARR